MDAQRLETLPPPPGVIASLQAGFSIVSGRIALIILPLLLDVFLWLGPRLSVGNWFDGALTSWVNFLRQNGLSARELAIYSDNAPVLVDFSERLNWLGWIRTPPIGIPALMVDFPIPVPGFILSLPQTLPVHTPLGVQPAIQLPSLIQIMGSIVLLTLLGWLGGGLYFRIVAGATVGESEAGIGLLRAFAQTILLSVIWVIGLVVIVSPILFLVGLLAIINALLAEAAFFIIMFFLFWLVVPMFFMPHGIFVRRQNAFLSILSSLRMSRFTLPTSSMFVLSFFLLSRGLSELWRVPSTDSWLMLIGIAGHAFISTALLSASFVYYRDMNHWLQTVYERFQQMGNRSSMKKV
jgi:hypothetical protein